MGISKRLKYIAQLVSPGNVVADIGTDHGFLPVFLLRQGVVTRSIAVDSSAGSIEKVKEISKRYGLEECLDIRQCDGLSGITPGEVHSIVIAGMGGILMTRILRDGINVVLDAKELILSPHRDADLVRQFIKENGFEITVDTVIEDKGKNYTVIKGIRKKLYTL